MHRRYAAVVPEAVLSVEWHWSRSATASTGPSDELHDMTRRFWLGLLAFPVLVLEMGSHLFRVENTVPLQYNTWLQLLLASLSCCGVAGHSSPGPECRYVTALNMFTLVAMGTGVAGFTASLQPSSLTVSCIVQKHGWRWPFILKPQQLLRCLFCWDRFLSCGHGEQTSGAITALRTLPQNRQTAGS
ncbi:Silver exporting P-type ATPase [Escherichia coli]|nr:Silver exporting P-type ATPase [Escherichia coli]